ncbi:MAG: hypothetical protein GXP56_03945 [Deltaproteobacteria bacterium]|nr:hypothetical protein [Deltaproteobacteria bacterium]
MAISPTAGQQNGGIGIMNTLKLEISGLDIKINTVAPNADTGMAEDVCIGDAARPICAEEVRDQFEQIKSLEDAKPYEHRGLIYALGRLLTDL